MYLFPTPATDMYGYIRTYMHANYRNVASAWQIKEATRDVTYVYYESHCHNIVPTHMQDLQL